MAEARIPSSGDKVSSTPAASRPHVFLSYSSRDRSTAHALCAAIESTGVRCWIAPRDIPPGTNYASGIIEAIHKSAAFVLVFSSTSNRSQHVQSEVERAFSNKVPIIAFRIASPRLTREMEYYLSRSQWLPAETGQPTEHFPLLAESIHNLLALQVVSVLACPSCAKQLHISRRHVGTTVRCLACGSSLMVSSGVESSETRLALVSQPASADPSSPVVEGLPPGLTAAAPALPAPPALQAVPLLEPPPRCPGFVGFVSAVLMLALCAAFMVLLFVALEGGIADSAVWADLAAPLCVVLATLGLSLAYLCGRWVGLLAVHCIGGVVLFNYTPDFVASWMQSPTPLLTVPHVTSVFVVWSVLYHLLPRVGSYFQGERLPRSGYWRSVIFWLPVLYYAGSVGLSFSPVRELEPIQVVREWPWNQWEVMRARLNPAPPAPAPPAAVALEIENSSTRAARFRTRYAVDANGTRREFPDEPFQSLAPGEVKALTLWPDAAGIRRYGFALVTANGTRYFYKEFEGKAAPRRVHITNESFARGKSK